MAEPGVYNAVNNATTPYPNVGVQTRAQYEASQVAKVNQLLGIVYALLALAVLIALIGIVNTLLLSVFERTHEIGLLRAVGMKRRQIRAMIRSEAVILATLRGDHRRRGRHRPRHRAGVLAQAVPGDHRHRRSPSPAWSLFLFIAGPARAWSRRAGQRAGQPSSTCWRPSQQTETEDGGRRPPAGWVTAAGSLREAQVSAGAPATTPRGASGMARSRTPHALKTALAMAGAIATIGVSPPPADG